MSITAAPRIDTRSSLESLDRDGEGFLLDASPWHPGPIHQLAAAAGLPLSGERLAVVHDIRDYFESRCRVPEARTLLKHMRSTWGEDKASRRYLYRLFPRGYGQQACKIAGMRKPRKLMLDV